MDSKVQLLIKILLYIGCLSAICTGLQNLQIEITPNNQVKPGSDVTITCSVDIDVGIINLVWVRKIGSYEEKIGTASGTIMNLESDFQRLGRYKVTQWKKGNKHSFSLKIEGVLVEDSGTLGCQRGSYRGGGEILTRTLAVCDSPGSTSCKCMLQQGWASPTCFEEPPDAKKEINTYKNALIGVVICLVIAIIYGVVVSIMLSRDIIAHMKAKAEKKLEAIKNRNEAGLADDQERLRFNNSGSDYSSELQHMNQYEDLQKVDEQEGPGSMYQQIRADVHHRGFPSDEGTLQVPRTPQQAPRAPQHAPRTNQQAPRTPQSQRMQERPHTSHPKASPQPQSAHTNQGYHQDEADLPNYEQVHDDGRGQKSHSNDRNDYNKNRGHNHNNNGTRPKQHSPSAFTAVTNDPRYHHLQPNTPANSSSNNHHQQPTSGSSHHHNNNNSPYQPSPSPMYKAPPAQYATYEGGLQTISQNVTGHPTPQSTRSERAQHSPDHPVEMQPRGAYTDVQKLDNPPPSRGRYSQPKKLDFVNGSATHDRTGAYVSQTDTVI